MVQINTQRVIDIIANMEDCINDLDRAFKDREEIEERYLYLCDETIRSNILNMFIVIENYVSCVLSRAGIRVDEDSFRVCIEKCSKLNYINENFGEYIIDGIKIRNYLAHRYGYPPTEKLIKFYKVGEPLFKDHITKCKEYLKSGTFK